VWHGGGSFAAKEADGSYRVAVWESPVSADMPKVGHGLPQQVYYSHKWLGHAQLTTTALYANAVGEEEQEIAARMW
jgi:hypothetical protein